MVPNPFINPSKDRWKNYFRFDRARIEGTTSVGRTTVWLLILIISEDRTRLRELVNRLGKLA